MHFLKFYVSHGSATRFFRGCEKYYIYFVDSLLLYPTVIEFSKLVNSWWSYCKNVTACFFSRQCILQNYWILLSYLFLFRNTRLSMHSGCRHEQRLSTSLPVTKNRCSEARYRKKMATMAVQCGYASTCSLHRLSRPYSGATTT